MKSNLPHFNNTPQLNLDNTIVLEVCQNCKNHGWNTRHDQEKYYNYATTMGKCIQDKKRDVTILYNQVPKEWAMEDIYCQLIPNNEKEVQCYDMIPRIGAMEVSYKGIIIFSKMMSSVWPNYEGVSKFVSEMFDDVKAGMSIQDLRKKYQTTGKVIVATQTSKKSTAPAATTNASMPKVDPAVFAKSLELITKNDITELKSLSFPPAKALTVLQAVMQLLGHGKKVQWSDCRKVLSQPNEFLYNLCTLDTQNLSAANIALAKQTIGDLTYDKLTAVSTCAAHLCSYVTAVLSGSEASAADEINTQPEETKVEAQAEEKRVEAPKKIEPKPFMCGSHMKAADDLLAANVYPEFPKGTHSLLQKYCTPELFQKMQNAKDDKGFRFVDAIYSGCKNTDSGIGVYAGSHDSYKAFAPLMDQIIQDYHGHGPTATHASKMSVDGMNCPIMSLAGQLLIKSTRIRVARNVAGYPLGPGISKQERIKLQDSIVAALKNLTGELEGTYYPLEGMDPQIQKQLIADHFLFKEGDRFLEACNLNRDWPSGRGIFHNKDKTFLVWVNEEDQLRIISMQPGASLFQVFKRLIAGTGAIESAVKFQHDSHLGYITACPTNLGTGLRASVHIHLPNLGKQKAQFQAIADKFHVQIRGAHGEHTETDDHIYDISNKRRLGFSEASLVQDMYNGVCAMIEAEVAMTNLDELLNHAHVFGYLQNCGVFQDGQNTHSEMNEASTQETSNKLVKLEIRAKDNLVKLVKQQQYEKDGWQIHDVLNVMIEEAKGTLKEQ